MCKLFDGTDIVNVVDNRLKHFLQAIEADPPHHGWGQYLLPEACKRAIGFMLTKQPAALRNWRAKQLVKIKKISDKARILSAALKALPIAQTSASVLALEQPAVREVNVGLLCLFCDVLDHPDVNLPKGYLTGFNVTGVVAPSNVLRPKAPEGTLEDFWTARATLMKSNDAWATTVANEVVADFNRAQGKRKALLHKVWQLTEEEHANGLSGAGLTLTQLRAKYGAGAHMRCRVLKRHGIYQGQKQDCHPDGTKKFSADGRPVMVEKIRVIDDSKRSRTNDILMRLCETIAPCNFTYAGYVAQELHDQRQQLQRAANPPMVFSMDDMRAAYRQVPTSDPEMCIVCIYSCKPGQTGARFYECWGHNFGHASSVCNYNRTPLLCCQIMRHWFAIPQESYVDDFCTPDFQSEDKMSDCGASAALSSVLAMISLEREPLKHQHPHQVNTFLGVETDLSHTTDTSDPYVEFRPSENRTSSLLDMLTRASAHGLDAHSAQVIQGKLRWILQAAWGNVARDSIQPLVFRASGWDASTEWNDRLSAMTAFLTVLFEHLPPLRWRLSQPRRKPVVVYTDAQYSTNGRKGIGVIVVDTDTGQRFVSGDLVPTHILDWITEVRGVDLQQKINQCELLAVTCAILTFSDVLVEREVTFWIDNSTALKCCVNGYSKYPDMADITNDTHLLLAGLRVRGHFLHVKGKANPADIPSRVPFIDGPNGPRLDPALLKEDGDIEAVEDIITKGNAVHRPLLVPSPEHLRNAATFIQFGRGWP